MIIAFLAFPSPLLPTPRPFLNFVTCTFTFTLCRWCSLTVFLFFFCRWIFQALNTNDIVTLPGPCKYCSMQISCVFMMCLSFTAFTSWTINCLPRTSSPDYTLKFIQHLSSTMRSMCSLFLHKISLLGCPPDAIWTDCPLGLLHSVPLELWLFNRVRAIVFWIPSFVYSFGWNVSDFLRGSA